MRVAVIHNKDRAGVLNVFGPQNRERYNIKTVELVAAALEKGGHRVRVIDGNMHVVDELRDFMPSVVAGDSPGMVFNMAYGIQGVSRYTHLPAMLEMLGVPYVGSGPVAHGMALDKVIAKIVFENAGLPTPKFWNFATANAQFDDLEFPVIVKPKMEAVSYGIRVVDNENDLREAVAEIIDEFGQHVLVEQFIPGREFAVGLLGNGDPEVFPILEVDLGGDPDAIQSASDKLRAPREKICPADLTPEKATELRQLVKRAFHSLELYDFARVDVRMDGEGRLYILEINSMASLGRTGSYVHAAGVAGYSYEELINRMLEVAAVRYFGQDYESPREALERKPKSEKLSSKLLTYLRSQAGTFENVLFRMVEMRSPANDPERVDAFADSVESQFRGAGFRPAPVPNAGEGHVLYLKNHDSEHNDVLLLGHLDTAPKSRPFIPCRIEGRRIYGTGVAEGKGGIVTALAAVKSLRFARALKKIKNGIVFTTDDTLSCSRSRAAVAATSAQADLVIGLKPADPDGGVIVSRSGRATYKITVAYRRREGTYEDVEVLKALDRRLAVLKDLESDDVKLAIRTLRFDAPFGQPKPAKAEAVVSVRFNKPEDAPELNRKIREIVKRPLKKGIRFEITGRVRRPAMPSNEKSQDLVLKAQSIAKKIHMSLPAHHRWHSSNIAFADPAVPKLDGMGPQGGGLRTPSEFVMRGSLTDHAALLALVMHDAATS